VARGGYSLDGLNADVYTLPLGYSWHDVPRDGWTVRLLAPVQAGFYSFKATDTNGARISINQQSLAFVPGAEVQIPIGERFALKPFAQFGVVQAFGDNVGNPYSYVYLGGARSVAQWHSGETTLSLGNAVIFAGDRTVGPGFQESYVSLQAGVEARHPLGFSIHGIAPDIGVYANTYYYPAALQFSRFLQPPLRVTNQGEIGFSIGTASPVPVSWWPNPRLGAGFIFGDGLSVWHVNFGFPF
jgi:hypothetical protein